MVEHLPQDSALAQRLGSWWTQSMEYQVVGLELVHEAMRVALAVGGVKPASLPKQLRIPRPYELTVTSAPPKPKRRPATADELRAILAAANRRR